MAESPTSPTAGGSQDLRAMVLGMSPEDAGLAPSPQHPRVSGLLMEMGVAEAVATLVVVVDGSVSLYFSHGGGIIGAGDHAAVRDKAEAFLAASEGSLNAMVGTPAFPPPTDGRVRFYALTFAGPLTAEADGETLAEGSHPLSRLFVAGHEVISAIRQLDQGADAAPGRPA